MTDYKKYINALRKCAKEHDNDRTSFAHIRVSDLCRDTANLLEELEQKPKTGHWIIISPTDMYCSECNEIEHLDTSRKFCAYCGTKMVGAQESEETDEDSD